MKPGEIARHITRGTFFLALEKVAALVSGTLYFAITLRWMGPTKYGILTLALAIVGLATVATGNFEVFLERYAAEYQARRRFDDLARAHRIALALKLGLGAIASVGLVVVSPLLARHYHMPELARLVPLLIVIVASDGLATTGRSLLFGLQRFEWVGGLSIVFHVVKTLLVGVLFLMRQNVYALAAALSALAALQAVLFSGAAWFVMREARASTAAGEPAEAAHGPALHRQIFAYCVPLLGARAAFLSGQNLGKIVLAKVLDATQLGYFSFAAQTMERFLDLVHTLPSSLLPSLTQLVAREERERLHYVFDQAFRLVQLVACIAAVGVFAFAPELTLWVASPLFAASLPVLRVFALVPLARTAQQPLVQLFQALGRPGLVLSLNIVKLCVELACYFAIVPAFGPVGAAWSSVGGASAAFFVALLLGAAVLPEGAGDRAGTVVRTAVLAVPSLLAVAFLDRTVPHAPASIVVRLALAVPFALAVFALGLVTRHDLEKLAALPVRGAWLRRVRDRFVAGADRVARTFEPRRAA